MCRTWCVLAVAALCLGLAHSWDIALSRGDLLEFYTNEVKTVTVQFKSHKLAALAYDEVHNMMLYVDKQSNNDTICGYDISSMENKCFIERNGRNIHGLAFDPVTELLFFTDRNERSINSISLKRGSNNKINDLSGNLLIKMDDGIPTDIAVDSCRGFVYWINTNLTTPVIERARLNGSEREVVINSNSLINMTYKLEPHSLVIDQQNQQIYWIEPDTSLEYPLCSADLNGKNKISISSIRYPDTKLVFTPPSSNTLTVSKAYLFWKDWCTEPECKNQVWKFPKTSETTSSHSKHYYTHFMLHDSQVGRLSVGIAANYKIADQTHGIKDCESLKSLEENDSKGPFCVHGVKVKGQSRCKCTLGYIGERCDVSVCENFCMQGSCSLNDDGLPKCRCNPGYFGKRCASFAW